MFTSKFVFCLLAVFALQHCCLALVGDKCPRIGRCKVGHCDDGICVCEDTEVASASLEKCLRVTDALGGGCEEDRQCTPKLGRFAHCVGNQCGCRKKATAVNKVCKKSGGLIGDRCINNVCDVGHCDHGLCACRQHTEIPSIARDACLIVPTTLGSGCEVDRQCTVKFGDLSHCYHFQCGCKKGAVAVNNSCRRK